MSSNELNNFKKLKERLSSITNTFDKDILKELELN